MCLALWLNQRLQVKIDDQSNNGKWPQESVRVRHGIQRCLKSEPVGSALGIDLCLVFFSGWYNLLCYTHSSLSLFFVVHNLY